MLEPPTRARHQVLVFVLLVTGITYLDRVCISAAAPAMSAELGLSDIQMGLVFSMFALSYGLFEVPVGWLGDRWGQRNMMTRIVACWSVFTMLTGMVRGYLTLLAVRFAFGAAEAGAFPTLARALARWFPIADRGRVNGLMWMGARIGGSVAPPLAVLLIGATGWRATFAIFGSIGLVWCVAFWKWFRDDPAEHPQVNAAELAYIRGNTDVKSEPAHGHSTPWRRIFLSGSLWALFWMYFATSYGYYFLVTWLPTYLIREHQLTTQQSGLYASVPLAVGAVGCLTGGMLSDWLVARLGIVWGRRLVGLGSYTLAALGYALAAAAEGPFASVMCLALAAGAMDMSVPVSWATCVEVGGRFGGTATGFMNTASSISAMISPIAAAWLFARFGSFSAMFASAAAVYLLAGLLWFKIDPRQTVSE